MVSPASTFLTIPGLALLVLGVNPIEGSSALSHASWTLGLRLYRALCSDGAQSTNALFSPVMLAGALGALGIGSRGHTAEQFQELLKTSGPQGGEALALKSMREGNGTAYTLHASTALFSKQAPGLDPVFLKEARGHYGLDHVPLGKDDKQDTDTITLWAAGAMAEAKVAQPSNVLQAQPGALLLASAVKFKGLWHRSFEEGQGDLRTFLGTKYTKIPMMHRAGIYRHYEDMENMLQVLEVDLKGGNMSMLLLLPFHVESLSRLDRLLSEELMAKWLERLTEQSIAISLPNVNLSSALYLQTQLAALGLKDAWDQKMADFSGLDAMKGQEALHLRDVLHWSSMELEEEDEQVEKPKLFYADHSFLLLVRDKASGALLLMGALDLAEGPGLHDEL
uniref:Serpin domain-containing protein n=1 Tax=Denticeps clupeoides TaxID=299321 RepID=A0AAY4BJK4_9TELE